MSAPIIRCPFFKFEGYKVIKKLKSAAAAIAAFAPASASALTFSGGPGTLADGDTFQFSTSPADVGAIAFAPEGPGSITINILNDVGTNMRLAFDLVGSTLHDTVFTLDGTVFNPVVGTEFSSVISGLSTLVVTYTGADSFDSIAFELAAVPLPAAAAMMLTALGGLALAKFRKS